MTALAIVTAVVAFAAGFFLPANGALVLASIIICLLAVDVAHGLAAWAARLEVEA